MLIGKRKGGGGSPHSSFIQNTKRKRKTMYSPSLLW